MDKVLVETQYLPSVAFFSAVSGAKTLAIERHEHYVKQSYRNRCQIVDASGQRSLTVPVVHGSGKTMIAEMRIDYSQKWVNNHWRSMQSAYGKAPYFEYYADDLQRILYSKPAFLYDLNMQLLSMCLKALRLGTTIEETASYSKVAENGVLDLRNAIDVKNPSSVNGIFTPVPYAQVFGSSFVENGSIIDLIFCVGPGAARIVKNSWSAEMNK
ncbi:WbqC family protein [Chryseolinea sp. T2]|uniref:WbqC family protein n=1 Tax=Chryseolinea sp. T2 TaxID=3129255 RepID=UPI0030777DAE